MVSDKGKRAQQKAKEAAPAQTAASKQQNTAVPGSQPPKSTSKSNKMRELNMKGAIKEGTDMDAFSTPEVPPVNDNCNQQPQKTQPVIENVKPVIDAPITVSNTTTTNSKPTEIKTLIKNRVDVTSIVKDVPKNLKPFPTNPIPVVTSQESNDETDRAVNEKIVQVKNEANIKANAADTNDNQVIDQNLIRYKKGKFNFRLTYYFL